MIITVDGPAAAGKGTLSQKLAEKYCLAYFDTGMVYRAVGLLMLQNGNDLADATAAEQEAAGLTFAKMAELSHDKDFRSAKGGQDMVIHGLQKLTLLDYPGHTACTVFTAHCP